MQILSLQKKKQACEPGEENERHIVLTKPKTNAQ